MRIVVNHLTRMAAPRICIGGIDPTTGHHVRPTTSSTDPITRTLLDEEGGPFSLGALVDLGAVRANPSTPEREDHLFSTASAAAVGQLDAEEYLTLIDRVAEDDLESIFDEDLERRGHSFAIEEGYGTVSLGVLRAQRRPELIVDSYGKLRLGLNDVEPAASLGVTDLRFVQADHSTLKHGVIADVQARLRQGVDPLLMVGLARAFTADGDDRRRHWAASQRHMHGGSGARRQAVTAEWSLGAEGSRVRAGD